MAAPKTPAAKHCHRGKKRCPAVWRCRACGRHVCEHLCGNKSHEDRSATCTRCSLEQAAKVNPSKLHIVLTPDAAETQLQTWMLELAILRSLVEKTRGEPVDVIADEVHCIAGRLEQLAGDMKRAVERMTPQ